MAKRKKHHKKKQTKQQPHQTGQAIGTTKNNIVSAPAVTSHAVQKSKTTGTIIAEAGSEAESTYVRQDVRYSLILIAIIAVVFVTLYLLLQNSTVSNTVYGLIKLPNIGN